MKTLKALKSQREGIEKINKIARAMQVIAATRLRRYEQRLLSFRSYNLSLQSLIKNLALRLKNRKSFWAEPAVGSKGALVILISSERGFCGSFNNQLFALIKDLKGGPMPSFIAIGKKGTTYLKRQQFELIADFTLPDVIQMPDFLQQLTKRAISFYREEKEKIYLIFNEFRSNLLGRARLQQLFPLEPAQEENLILDYLFEPSTETLLDEILPHYVYSEIKAAILESQAAEEMARMVAMTQATRSAEDLIKNLTQQYHKARQAGITRELTELVNAVR